MDEQSLQYITAMSRKLRELAELSGASGDTTAFIVEQLKRFGYKLKTVGACVYCDVGRGKVRHAFFADTVALSVQNDTAYDSAAQTANLLNVARIVGAKSEVPLRFIFAGGDADISESSVTDCVTEVFALRFRPESERGKIGYCYGAMCAGCCEFTIDFGGKSAHSEDVVMSAEYVAEQACILADNRSVSVKLRKTSDGIRQDYTVVFYEIAACEGFMIDLERAALKADDSNGTVHTVTASKVYPPLVNHALAVDRIRSVMGENCIAVPPCETPDGFSQILEKVAGCAVWLGVGQSGQNSPHFESISYDESVLIGTELFIKLIESYKA